MSTIKLKTTLQNIVKHKYSERIFFFVVTLVSAYPLFVSKYFPTLDGPAHLYNSNIINQLLFGKRDLFSEFFMFNAFPVPNWIGHFILCIFNLFLPAFIAEKILIAFYLFGLPYAFRAVIRYFNSGNTALSYLIFPFVYSFLFLLGMYNFSISILFMLITIAYYAKNRNHLYSVKNIFMLFILFMLTYFSHFFTFIILVIAICLLFMVQVVNDIKSNNRSWMLILKKTSVLVFSFIIPLIFSFVYFYTHHKGSTNNIFLGKNELIKMLINLRAIIVYSFLEEENFTTIIAYVIMTLFFIVIYSREQSLSNSSNHLSQRIKNSIFQHDIILIVPIFLLILYFILPDSDGYAGFVSVRLELLFFTFVSLWIGLNKTPKILTVICVFIILVAHFMLVAYYSSIIKKLSITTNQCIETSKYIENGSIVLPLDYSDDWLMLHFSNYLAIDRPIVVLENYESKCSYFPIRWNNSNPKSRQLLDENRCEVLYRGYNLIDYVFILGDIHKRNDECTSKILDLLKQNCTMIHQKGMCTLWKIRR